MRDDKDRPEEELQEFKDLKKILMKQKALIIKQAIDTSQKNQSMTERINHLYSYAETQLDKYLLLFSIIKLAIVQGKCVILCNDPVEAYRVKLFLNRFQLKAFCILPDMPKNQATNITHFFHIG